MSKICLFGASGHGKVIKDLADGVGLEVVAFFDDSPNTEILNAAPVIHSEKQAEYAQYKLVISIGNNKIRKTISEKLKTKYISLVDKAANVTPNVVIGKGTVIMKGAQVNADVVIGNHVIVNTAAVIEHDCTIADFVHISPNATITGNVSIGLGAHIGAGAVIIPGIKIGKWVTVGAGAVVIRDISDYAVVVGNPAKIIKYSNE